MLARSKSPLWVDLGHSPIKRDFSSRSPFFAASWYR